MEDYGAIIRNVFEMGSVRDANELFVKCIENAFPTFRFRGLELVRFLKENKYMEGKSWNHVFEIKQVTLEGSALWEVTCHRVTMGKSPDKIVHLDYMTLGFVQYKEID